MSLLSDIKGRGRSDVDDLECIGDSISEYGDDGLSLCVIKSGKLYLLDGSTSDLH